MMPNSNPCADFTVGNVFEAQLQAYAKEHAVPLSANFELTPRCNFNCRMCYVHLSTERIVQLGRELNADEWIDLAQQALEAQTLSLCLTGGEPLLHPEFEKIYRAVSQMGFRITLQTNASALSEQMLRLLNAYPPHTVKTSIYGSNDEVYQAVCGVKNGFTRVDAGLRALQNLGIPILAVTTVIQQNRHDIPNIHEYTRKLQIPWIYTSAVHPSVRGADTKISEVAINEETATDFRADVKSMLSQPPRKADDKPCDYCKENRTSFWITWDGQMRFCSFMNEPNISVRDKTLTEAWQELVAYEEQLRWPDDCYHCEVHDVCRMCAGALAARSSSIHKVNKDFCDKFKAYVKQERRDF